MIIWNVANDIEVKKIEQTGSSVVSMTVATNRKYKNKDQQAVEETEFHRCVAYWALADLVWKFLSKGRKVYVEWRLRTRTWEDTTGQKKYMTEVIADNVIFLDKKDSSADTNSNAGYSSYNDDTPMTDDLPF